MKNNLKYTMLLVALFFALSAQGQIHRIIRLHDFMPFAQFKGDTVEYLLSIDGGVEIYDNKPMSHFFQDMNASLPIKTFFPYYGVYNESLVAFFFFVYTKEQLKDRIKRGEPVYALTVALTTSVDKYKNTDIRNYFRQMGLGKILPWTSEAQQKISNLILLQVLTQDATVEVKRYLEYNP